MIRHTLFALVLLVHTFSLSISPLLLFFFKQKTAYELRISDWSSDVCSSDLINPEWGLIVTRRGSYTFVKTAETTIRIIIPSIAYGRIQMKIVRLELDR